MEGAHDGIEHRSAICRETSTLVVWKPHQDQARQHRGMNRKRKKKEARLAKELEELKKQEEKTKTGKSSLRDN